MFKLLYLLVAIQVFKVQSSQPPVHQYVHVTGGYHALPYTLANPTNYKEPHPNHVIPAPPVAYPGIPQTMPTVESTKPPELPKKCDKDVTNTFDTSLLNNLAIALQLLIVSNILNMPQDAMQEIPLLKGLPILSNPELPIILPPKPELPIIMAPKSELPIMMSPKSELPIMMSPKSELPLIMASQQELPITLTSKAELPAQKQEKATFTIIYKPYDQTPIVLSPYDSSPYKVIYDTAPTHSDQNVPQYYIKDPLPNANYLSSGFAEPNILSPIGATKATTTRKSMTLMSPYEALGTSLEPIGATSKREIQSPYASILADNDLFSLSDLF